MKKLKKSRYFRYKYDLHTIKGSCLGPIFHVESESGVKNLVPYSVSALEIFFPKKYQIFENFGPKKIFQNFLKHTILKFRI